MKKAYYLVLLLDSFITAKTQTNLSLLNVYQLKLGNTGLYEKYETFIAAHGIPPSIKVAYINRAVKTKADIDQAIKSEGPDAYITLTYKAFLVGHHNGNLVPHTVDIRQLKEKLVYQDTVILDTNFSLAQFSQLFPVSAQLQFPGGGTHFKGHTRESGTGYTHYLLQRSAQDGTPTQMGLEFTFYDHKLIFIFFTNG